MVPSATWCAAGRSRGDGQQHSGAAWSLGGLHRKRQHSDSGLEDERPPCTWAFSCRRNGLERPLPERQQLQTPRLDALDHAYASRRARARTMARAMAWIRTSSGLRQSPSTAVGRPPLRRPWEAAEAKLRAEHEAELQRVKEAHALELSAMQARVEAADVALTRLKREASRGSRRRACALPERRASGWSPSVTRWRSAAAASERLRSTEAERAELERGILRARDIVAAKDVELREARRKRSSSWWSSCASPTHSGRRLST